MYLFDPSRTPPVETQRAASPDRWLVRGGWSGEVAKRLEREGWSRRAAALRAAALRPIQQPQNKENQQYRYMRKVILIIFSYYVKKNA